MQFKIKYALPEIILKWIIQSMSVLQIAEMIISISCFNLSYLKMILRNLLILLKNANITINMMEIDIKSLKKENDQWKRMATINLNNKANSDKETIHKLEKRNRRFT